MDKETNLEMKAQFLDTLLARNLSWIAAADSKVPSIFAIDIAMLGALGVLALKVNKWTICWAILSSLAAITLLGSVFFLVLVAFPRLKGPKGSLVYFGGIVQYAEDTFIKKVLQGPSEEILEDLARQTYRNAEIASRKFSHVYWAMICMFVSVPFWIVAIAFLYAER
jgi:hypothetical protein